MISMLSFVEYSNGVVDGPRKITSCGIYGIYCSANGNWYVGKSVNIKHRLQDHHKELSDNRHKNKHLQNAFNKHGSCSFTFFELEVCPKDDASSREMLWIQRLDSIKSGFNMTTGGDGGIHCEETKSKISKSLTGKKRPPFSAEWRARMSASQKKRTQPQVVKDKISSALKGRIFTDEWRANISAGRKEKFARKQQVAK